DHRAPLREQHGGDEIAPLPVAQPRDLGVVGLTLDPAVPRSVVVGAVFVVLAVGLVALVVVGDQVAKREPVVRGDEVDARPRLTPIPLVEAARSGEAVRDVAHASGLATPEVSDGVTERAVPLGPAHWEI